MYGRKVAGVFEIVVKNKTRLRVLNIPMLFLLEGVRPWDLNSVQRTFHCICVIASSLVALMCFANDGCFSFQMCVGIRLQTNSHRRLLWHLPCICVFVCIFVCVCDCVCVCVC